MTEREELVAMAHLDDSYQAPYAKLFLQNEPGLRGSITFAVASLDSEATAIFEKFHRTHPQIYEQIVSFLRRATTTDPVDMSDVFRFIRWKGGLYLHHLFDHEGCKFRH